MDVENIEYFLSDRISKRKRQYRNRCPNQKRKQGHSKRKKNIFERINTGTN